MRLRLITVCAALAVGGCGGSDEREAAAPASGDTMPAAQWATQVEEICDSMANEAERKGVEIMQRVQAEGGSEEEAVAQVLEYAKDQTGPWLDKVAAMPAPEGKEQQAQEFDRRMRDMVPNLQELADASRASETDIKPITDRFLKEVLPVRALARDLNIHACIPRNSQP
jgi:hypothetical protein